MIKGLLPVFIALFCSVWQYRVHPYLVMTMCSIAVVVENGILFMYHISFVHQKGSKSVFKSPSSLHSASRISVTLSGLPCFVPSDCVGEPDTLARRKFENITWVRGTQRSNVSKYVRSVSNCFLYALEACLVNLELSYKLLLYSEFVGEVW